MKNQKIGIFKVNAICDGGYYIDKYLNSILHSRGIDVEKHAFLKTGMLENYKCHYVNYKNPFLGLWSIHRIILKNKITIAYSNQFIALAYLCFLKKTFCPGLRVIGKVDGKTIRLGIKKFFYFFYDFSWDIAKNIADHIIFETNTAKGKWLNKKCEVLYTPAVNFYNVDIEKLSHSSIEPFVQQKLVQFNAMALFVGRYSWEKGYEYIGALASELPHVLFITIGGDRVCFKQYANIAELGKLTISEIIPYYNVSNFLLVPSTDDSFPSVIREYSFFNKPIVATNVGSFFEFQKLGMEIVLCEPNKSSLLIGIKDVLNKNNLKNNNRIVYDKNFNPNNEKTIDKYCSIFRGNF